MLDIPTLDLCRVSPEDVGITTAILATHAGRMLTGATTYVEGGYHVMG